MRLQSALTALVASSPFFAAVVADATSLPVSSIDDDSTMTTTTKTTTSTRAMAGMARDGGIQVQPGASPHPHHRRTAEQMRRRRDRILQRKEAAVAAAAAAANDGDVAAQQAKRRAAKEASAIVEQALAAGVKDGDAILRMVDDQVATEHDAGDGRVAAAAKDATDDADIGVDESLSMHGRSGEAVPVPSGASDEAAAGGLLRTATGAGTGAANGTAGSNLSSHVKAGRTTASSVRRAVHVPADPANEVRRAKASSSDGHDDGILSSIADDIASSTIAADGLHGLTDAEAAEAARALTQGKVETDAGMLPSVARDKHKGKDEAALRAAGLTSASINGSASVPGSGTGSIRRAKAAAAPGAALRRSVSPAAQAAADIAATTASAAGQLVQPPLQEGDEGKYIMEDDGRSDVGIFVGSSSTAANDGTSKADSRRDLGAATTSSCPPPGEDPNEWVDCVNGIVRGTSIPCGYKFHPLACAGRCCIGGFGDFTGACSGTTACIKKDGSCFGSSSCKLLGQGSSYEIQISGPSCTGDGACRVMFEGNTQGTGAFSITNSCLCAGSCGSEDYFDPVHCHGGSPTPLSGLPSCGNDIIDVAGQTGSWCTTVLPAACPPPGEDPNEWVDCVNGFVRGTGTTCEEACNGQCCARGLDVCYYTTACIKKDGSCLGSQACFGLGQGSSYEVQVSGPSCLGGGACRFMFEDKTQGTGVISVTNSCLCFDSCNEHCGYGFNFASDPLPGLPACGTSLDNITGQTDQCAVTMLAAACAPSGEDATEWVDCVNGYVRGTDTKCFHACSGQCCTDDIGRDACEGATACIKKDGSCNPIGHDDACSGLGRDSSYEIQVSGPSCTGWNACTRMFEQNTQGTGVISITNSCLCDDSCSNRRFECGSGCGDIAVAKGYHCTGIGGVGYAPAPLANLPACGSSFDNIIGRTGKDTCTTEAPTLTPSTAPSSMPSTSPSLSNIVSCCASAEFIPNGRRLQDGNTTTVPSTVVEFTTAIAYTVNTAVTEDVWQVAFADAINSDMFGDMIGGTVEDLQQLNSGSSGKSMKSSKSAVVSGGSKSSKSASSTGGSNMSSKSMKSASSSF